VDGCENEGDIPHLVNAAGPQQVVRAAKAAGARSVYFSTDYVFPGDKENHVYDEESQCNPINVYGSSKLAGEKAVMKEDPDVLVLRTSGVFGPENQGKNFVYQLCNALAEQRDMQCANDSFGSPTYNRDLAKMTVDLLASRATGVYHCVGPDTLDRYSFAVLIATTFGLDVQYIKAVDSQSLYQTTMDKLGYAACRGKHMGLSIVKLKQCLPEVSHPRDLVAALNHWKENPRGAKCNF